MRERGETWTTKGRKGAREFLFRERFGGMMQIERERSAAGPGGEDDFEQKDGESGSVVVFDRPPSQSTKFLFYAGKGV